MARDPEIGVLFVCLGNICRSPTAQGVFTGLLEAEAPELKDRIAIDSAGTHAYHVGSAPDRRATEAARQRGYDLIGQTARKAEPVDFEEFDYVLAMDHENYANLERIAPAHHRDKLRMFLDFAPGHEGEEVPDPYYGGSDGFQLVLDRVEAASRGLLADIRQRLETKSGS